MTVPLLVLQFGVLCFTGLVWYLARRDLAASAAVRHSPSLNQLREVQATVERLLAVLEEKAAEIEERLQKRFDALAQMDAGAAGDDPGPSPAEARLGAVDLPESDFVPAPLIAAQAAAPAAAQIATPAVEAGSIERALEMVKSGLDLRTAANATGLTVAEIEMAQRLRALRSSRQA